MTVPDTLYEVAEYSKCPGCGWKAALLAEHEDGRGLCANCWIRTEKEIVNALPEP